MTDNLPRPAWVTHFNQFGPASVGAGRLLALDGNELKRLACEATGLDDFGEFPWEESFERLLWGLDNEARLNTLGRLMTRAELLRTLAVRLRLTDLWRRHPEILDSEVTAPIVIAGAARTGTSILQETLSQDPQFHLPYTYKCLDPLPLGDDADTERAARIGKAQCEAEFWVDVQPEIRAMHDFGAELPTECIVFMSADYSHDYWGMVADMPSWNAWRLEQGYFNASYRWHKRLLQTMQYNEPADRVWLLKSPAHLAFLDVLKEVYPDVRIIHTHRDPVKCIPSTASITSTVRWARSDEVDYRGVGDTIALGFQFAMENVIDQREDGRLPESQIVDIHLRDLIDDPVAAIRRAYDHFDLPFAPSMADRIITYLANKPKGKFGEHRYDMAKFGMSERGLRESFRRYTEHYGVAIEA